MQIGNYILDNRQEKIVRENHDYLLVSAGAGSGKTLTILGKISYLINEKNLKPEEILCLSFTKAAASSLKEKIKKEISLDIPTYTFHKLSLEIIKENKTTYNIADECLLENCVNEFFEIDIYESDYLIKLIGKYFNRKIKNQKEDYIKIITLEKSKFLQLKRLCITFIRLMKSNDYHIESFLSFISKIKRTILYSKYKKEKIVLTLILNIYLKYETYLKENKEVDFDDMLSIATKIVKEKGIKQKVKYIIIDEYQDTSLIRFYLIKEIMNKTNAKLMVVGDDFQSIYKFTGCDISLFLNFNKFFPTAKIMKLERTYRNSNELIQIAGTFIMKNKKQIKKQLYSKKQLTNPIKILKYNNIKKIFLEIIKELSKNKEQKILVLGRNNNDISMLLNENITIKDNKIIIKNYEFLDITYMTVHKSKGLESDNVILINLSNKITGFPSQIKEEKLTRLVTKTNDRYPYSEERRLFYVALTRTKNYVYLLTPQKSPSIFIEELEKIIHSLEK